MRRWLLLVILLVPFSSFSQTFDQWKNLVNWDGTTHWWKYLTISPKYFGPNALTVPFINNGSIDTNNTLGITANLHFSKGDNTQNFTLYGNFTTKRNTISVDAQFIPYERFNVSHAKKVERKVYYKDYYDKQTVGDVVVNTTIQLLERFKKYFQLALRVGLRMPSGGSQGAARYADVPGYWIDLGWAIPFKNTNWKWIAMGGFYVWQTNSDDLRQDDSFLYGSGFEFNHKGFHLQAYGAGYLGYRYNGDRPIIVRMNFEKRKNKTVYIFRLQQGLKDFAYFSAESGVRFILGK
jgi:hypothetical protein